MNNDRVIEIGKITFKSGVVEREAWKGGKTLGANCNEESIVGCSLLWSLLVKEFISKFDNKL
jgi:hypothetical protein